MISETDIIIMLAGLVIGHFMFSWLFHHHRDRFPPSMKGQVHAWLAISGACASTTAMFGNFAIVLAEIHAGRGDTVELAWEGNFAAGNIGLSLTMLQLVIEPRRVCRRLEFNSYAARALVSRAA